MCYKCVVCVLACVRTITKGFDSEYAFKFTNKKSCVVSIIVCRVQ